MHTKSPDEQVFVCVCWGGRGSSSGNQSKRKTKNKKRKQASSHHTPISTTHQPPLGEEGAMKCASSCVGIGIPHSRTLATASLSRSGLASVLHGVSPRGALLKTAFLKNKSRRALLFGNGRPLGRPGLMPAFGHSKTALGISGTRKLEARAGSSTRSSV